MKLGQFFGVLLSVLILVASVASGYEKISDGVWKQIQPCLLPDDHPIKKRLDKMFSKQRVIADEDSLKKAGFKLKKRKSDEHIYVAKHPKLKGYLLKFVLDSQIGRSDGYVCTKRLNGVRVIKEAIDKYGYEHYFKVPKKWVYLLPDKPKTPAHYDKKHMILVVENMHLLDDLSNRRAWKSSAVVTKDLLNALYHMISELGLVDSVYIDNIPFCRDRKIGFIDTEHVHIWPVPYHRLRHYMSEKRKGYWMSLIRGQE